MPIYRIDDFTPRIDDSAWVADNATLIGQVELAARASIWFNAVLRADTERIAVGPGSNVQDGSVLHADPGFVLTLGENVTVGHRVMLHGCTIGDGSLVGMQSTILNGARIGRDCLVGAGSLVTEGREFPDGMLIVGSPARAVRPLSPRQRAMIRHAADHYVENAARYRRGLRQIAPAPGVMAVAR